MIRYEVKDLRLNRINRRGFLQTVPCLGATAFSSPLNDHEGGGQAKPNHGCITDVGNIRVGHFSHSQRPTGCTVILFDQPAITAVEVRGSAPGTRETDLLNPINTVQQAHAVLLSGGSAFGLDAAGGVMRFLEERGIGFHVGSAIVPIVPAAVLFDLQIGDSKIRPTAESGYQACASAASSAIAKGCVGAGTGATVGKLFGKDLAMKSGIGSASSTIGNTGLIVGAIVAVNAVGDVLDHETGRILAGARAPNKGFLNSLMQIKKGSNANPSQGAHTTIGVIATNAVLTKTQAAKIAQMAHDGLARSINPVHTTMDGDTIFAAATGTAKVTADLTTIGSVGADVMAYAVRNAVLAATSIPGYPSSQDWKKS